MKSIISIDEATLEKGVAYARKYFRGTKIDDLVSQYSGKSADPENDAKLAFDSFARFCGAYAALRHTYNESGMFNGSIEDMNTQNFMDIPSGFGASLAGLKYLESREHGLDESEAGKKYFKDIEFSPGFGSHDTRVKSFLDSMINSYSSGISRVRNGRDVLQLTRDFFAKVKEDSVKAKERYPSHSQIVNAYTIKIDGVVMEGFKDIPAHAAPKLAESIGSGEEIKVVGNYSAKKKLDKSLTGLLCYNSKTKSNVIEDRYGYPRTMLLYGQPGTGKTTTIKSRLQKFAKKADQYGKKLYYQDITNCFKSEYMNKSSNNLREIFETAKKSDGCWVFYCDDIDTIFFSREEAKNRPDEKANLEVLMHFLERANLDDYKNFVFVGTTNHRELLDNAVLSRLGIQVLVEGPQTGEEHAELFQDKLKRGIDVGYVQVEDWTAMGEESRKLGLAGRDIAKICEDIADEKQEEGFPDDIIGMSDDEKTEVMDKLLCSSPITGEDLLKRIAEKYSQLAEVQEDKFTKDVAGEVYRRTVDESAKMVFEEQKKRKK